jgi:hypothetical protein
MVCLALGACADGGPPAPCTSVWTRPGFALQLASDTAFPDGEYVFTVELDGQRATYAVDVTGGWGQCTAPGCAADASEPGLLIAINGDDAYVEDWNGRDDAQPSAGKVIVQLERGGWTMGAWRFFPIYQGVQANGVGCGTTWYATFDASVTAPAR